MEDHIHININSKNPSNHETLFKVLVLIVFVLGISEAHHVNVNYANKNSYTRRQGKKFSFATRKTLLDKTSTFNVDE